LERTFDQAGLLAVPSQRLQQPTGTRQSRPQIDLQRFCRGDRIHDGSFLTAGLLLVCRRDRAVLC
jgi:hypothetical protein